MGNLNIDLTGHTKNVVESMIRKGYAKSKTEAIRLALFEFDREYKIVDDRELDSISYSASINSMKKYFNDPNEDKAWNKYL